MKIEVNRFLLFWVGILCLTFFNVLLYAQNYTISIPIFRLQMVDFAFTISVVYFFIHSFQSKKLYLIQEKPLVLIYSIWLGFTLFSSLLLYRFNYHFVYPFFAHHFTMNYFMSFSVLMICSNKDYNFDGQSLQDFIMKCFNFLIFPIVLFGLTQFVFKTDFLSLNSDTKILQVKSDLLGSFRPRSIFNSSYEFGLFCGLPLVFSLAIMLDKRTNFNVSNLVVFITSLIGVALCQTRNVYLVSFLSMLTLLVIYIYPKRSILIKLFPWVSFAIMLLVFIYVSINALGGDALQNFLSGESSLVRLSFFFTLYEGLVLKSSLLDILFGWGLIQHAGDSNLIWLYPDIYNSEDGTLGIDNLFIGIFLQFGLIGLILFILTYQQFWNVAIKKLQLNQNFFFKASLSLFSVYLAAGMFNLIQVGFWGCMVWFLLLFNLSTAAQVNSTKI